MKGGLGAEICLVYGFVTFVLGGNDFCHGGKRYFDPEEIEKVGM
jgi:hypothetical protein